MSRLVIALSVIASLSSIAAADRVDPTFARAPSEVEMPDRLMPRPMPSRAEVRAALIEARAANLARFRSYYRAKSYPSNVYTSSELNVWRDEQGHFCAAATIIRMSGATELVDRVAEDNNNIKLADVRQGAVMDWMLTSGFTQAELALIQRPMRPVVFRPPHEPSQAQINARMRARETARLLALYKQIDAKLVAAAASKKSLDAATDRLMRNPQLATELVYPSS